MAHDRVFGVCDNKCFVETIAKAENPVKDVRQIDDTLRIEYIDGTTKSIPFASVEQIVNFRYNQELNKLELTNLDGVVQWIDLSDFVDDKADVNGVYKGMTVGTSYDLVSRGDATNQEFTYRTSGSGKDISDGVARIERIKGNSIIWNQLIPHLATETTETKNGVTITRKTDGSFVFNGTATDRSEFNLGFGSSISLTRGHKYLLKGVNKMTNKRVDLNSSGWEIICNQTNGGDIKTLDLDVLYLSINTWEGTFNDYVVMPQLFDLTLMFGEGNEPSTVEEFEKLFPLNYYDYSEPTLANTTASAIKTVGFNLLDVQSYTSLSSGVTVNSDGKVFFVGSGNSNPYRLQIRFFKGNNVIHIENANLIVNIKFDYDKLAIVAVGGNDTRVIWFNNFPKLPKGERIIFTYKTVVSEVDRLVVKDICINFSHSGYRDGEYEPYWEEVKSLPIQEYFPNGMCSTEGVIVNNIKGGFDEITADKVIQRCKVVDLGELTWTRRQGLVSGNYYFEASTNFSMTLRGLCGKYERTISVTLSVTSKDKLIAFQTNSIYIKDDTYTTAQAFKTSLSGVMAVVELTSPIETPIAPWSMTYRVSDFGTEEALNTIAPLKADIAYSINATDSIRNLGKNFISMDSFNNLRQTLSDEFGVLINAEYDSDADDYNFSVSENEVNDRLEVVEGKVVELEEYDNKYVFEIQKTPITSLANITPPKSFNGVVDLSMFSNPNSVSFFNYLGSSQNDTKYNLRKLIIKDMVIHSFGWIVRQSNIEELFLDNISGTIESLEQVAYNCPNLRKATFKNIDTSNVINCTYLCGHTPLTELTLSNNWLPNNAITSFSLSDLSLTHASAVDVLNKLADRSSVQTATITFKQSVYQSLTSAEKQIGLDKNWNVTYA